MKKELRLYRTTSGKIPFSDWLEGLKDKIARAHVTNRLTRLVYGQYGDCKSVGDGVYELRIHYSPGYRIYFTEQDKTYIILLIGGSKRTQERDIKKAKHYVKDVQERVDEKTTYSETNGKL